ncbi:MAG: helix-turn-helix domain containing protein [Bryobacterales bacterium]|nr:helix-turn-helix domain containing protein [Bryobacterales bacterium]
MHPLNRSWEDIAAELRKEILVTPESCYQHRLHAILLIARGLSARRVAGLLGDSPGAVADWVRRYLEAGPGGLLSQPAAGRKSRLTAVQLSELRRDVLSGDPNGHGWSGKSLAAWIECKYAVRLQVRQCQRILRQLKQGEIAEPSCELCDYSDA